MSTFTSFGGTGVQWEDVMGDGQYWLDMFDWLRLIDCDWVRSCCQYAWFIGWYELKIELYFFLFFIFWIFNDHFVFLIRHVDCLDHYARFIVCYYFFKKDFYIVASFIISSAYLGRVLPMAVKIQNSTKKHTRYSLFLNKSQVGVPDHPLFFIPKWIRRLLCCCSKFEVIQMS